MTEARKIAVVTVGRSDFGRYRPILRALKGDPAVELRLLATGGHYSHGFGHTLSEIADSGFAWEDGLEMTLDADTPTAVGKAIGLGTISLAQAFAHCRPDLLVLLGDRYEMLCGAAAALGFNLPIVHIHGGAVTEGAIDEQVRHALTKMSHYHLVSCEEYAVRVRQMGEEDWRVQVVGAPGLDELPMLASLSRAEVSERVGLDLGRPTLLVCQHPVTLAPDGGLAETRAVLEAVEESGLQFVLTYPNVDPGSRAIIEAFETVAARHPDRARLIRNAGTNLYVSLLSTVDAMVGNSSSAIVEAPSFRLPAVNVGSRQDGKLKAANIIDVAPARSSVLDGILRAVDPAFRTGLAALVNPYGDGKAGPRIAQVLRTLPLDERLRRKKFVDHTP